MKVNRLVAVIVSGIAIMLLGILLPWIISVSSAKEYRGEEEVFARFSIQQAEQAIGGSFESVLVPSMYVASIEQLSSESTSCAYEPFLVEHKYAAIVRLVSWFGIPYGEVYIDCEGWSSIERF